MKRGNLVQGRRPGQALLIGRGITITFMEITVDGEVKVAIEAPDTVAITRSELGMEDHIRHQQARERAARVRPGE